MVDYYFDLPIDPGGVPRTIHVSQYDTGRMFFMRLVKNGSPFIPPDGTYAEIIGINAKRIPFELSAGLERTTVTTNGVNTTTEVHCVRELDPVVTDGAGRVPIQVVLKHDDVTIEGGEDILGTAVIVLEVHRAGATKEDIANAPYFMDAIATAVNNWLNEHPPASGGVTEELKQALLDCFEHVAWIDDQGQDYYDALYAALYPPVDVLSISAAFTQGSAVIHDTDSLDTLKQYLVVTATMTDSTTQTLEDTDYTISGTLAVGTSTITVSYEGKTDTFTVTVTEHQTTLDDIAYGTLTYRDIFITNNKISYLGDFEGEGIVLQSNNYFPISGQQDNYRINAGSVSVSTDDSNTQSHSLKAFGSSSNQLVINGFNGEAANTKYLCACAVKVTRYTQGKCGIQGGSPQANATARFNIGKEATTSGWEYFTDLCVFPSNQYFCYIGSWTSANLDGYVDDVVISPVPSEMTAAEAQALYEEYIAIRLREGAST